jgi:PEP-CTERM motif
MTRALRGLRPTLAGLALTLAAQAHAGLAYQEGTDLADNPGAATALGALSVGANTVSGTVGRTTTTSEFSGGGVIIVNISIDLLDAFNFELLAGQRITSWTLTISGFGAGGAPGQAYNASAIGLGSSLNLAANQVFQSNTDITTAGVLAFSLGAPTAAGTTPFGPTCDPLFDLVCGPVLFRTGAEMTYELVVNVETASVPEPGSLALTGLAGLGAIGALGARRRRHRPEAPATAA